MPLPNSSNWKKLKQHPISAEYPDLAGAAFDRLVDRVRRFGVVDERKIKLLDGMVFDGWQVYRACVETNKMPGFKNVKLPVGMDGEQMTIADYKEICNDLRRHETVEIRERRAEQRRQRVAEAIARGESQRAVAEKEGVGRTQVQRDLAAAGGPPGPPAGKTTVKGRDGKTYTRKKKDREPGDDTGNIRGKPSRNGKPKYNWRELEKRLGHVVRAFEELKTAFGEQSKEGDFRGLESMLREILNRIEALKHRLTHQKAS